MLGHWRAGVRTPEIFPGRIPWVRSDDGVCSQGMDAARGRRAVSRVMGIRADSMEPNIVLVAHTVQYIAAPNMGLYIAASELPMSTAENNYCHSCSGRREDGGCERS